MPLSRRVRILVRWLAVLAGIGCGGLAMLLMYGTALVDRAIRGPSPGSTCRVLSAPLELRAGDPWDLVGLRAALAGRGVPEAVAGRPRSGEFAVDGGSVWLGAGVAEGTRGAIALVPTASGLALVDTLGAPLASLSIRPTVLGTAGGDVVTWPIPLGAMAPVLLTAVVDVEDRTFLSHSGLSLRGLFRAAVRDLLAGGVREGGSTITQQLAKIMLLRPSRSVPRKVTEAWLATLLEYRFSKRAILEAYLNRVYLGQDGGRQIQGVEAAAHFYFGKRAFELGVDEAALLAGLIAAPNRFDPLSHPEAARSRRNAVLAAMVREGHLDAPQARALASAALPGEPHRLRAPFGVHFVEYLLANTGNTGELASTLDVALQLAVREGCLAGLRELEGRHPQLQELARSGDPLQAAVVVLGPDGRLMAMQGSRVGLPGEFNRAAAARRQIGSLVKPFVVGAALQAGWSETSMLPDEPLELTVGRQIWRPTNSDGRFRGWVTVHDALTLSLNVPIVRLGLEVSVPTVAETLRHAGFSVTSEGPALLLGTVEASPLEVARAYAVFLARGGRPIVRLERGTVVSYEPVFHPSVAANVRVILEDVPRLGTAAVLAETASGPLAAKTGTTDERRDSWFVALRPATVTVVWVGTDGNRETGLYGATGALEVWRQIDSLTPRIWRRGEF